MKSSKAIKNNVDNDFLFKNVQFVKIKRAFYNQMQ